MIRPLDVFLVRLGFGVHVPPEGWAIASAQRMASTMGPASAMRGVPTRQQRTQGLPRLLSSRDRRTDAEHRVYAPQALGRGLEAALPRAAERYPWIIGGTRFLTRIRIPDARAQQTATVPPSHNQSNFVGRTLIAKP